MPIMDSQKLLSVDNENMNKLKEEINNLEKFGFETTSVSGYGEGVFVVTVTMQNPKADIKTTLSIPQCEEDGIMGNVSIVGNGILPSHLRQNYRF